jgi:RNA polymerase sigma factor (sigma-70 family)
VSSLGIATLVHAAADGDEAAWNELVDRFSNLVWAVARAHRLGDADAADVSQTTWLRLVEQLGRLRDPERVGAWLATVARNESLRVLRRNARGVPVADEDAEVDWLQPAPDARLVTEERDAALWRAFANLPEGCRDLLRILVADPEPSYTEVAAALGMPIGSIGPTRARCLERLRRSREVARISDTAGGSYEETT